LDTTTRSSSDNINNITASYWWLYLVYCMDQLKLVFLNKDHVWVCVI
jgi:hypothetical protein